MRGRLLPSPLHYVEQVVRLGSIQRAARELNIAASAIDRQILGLEAEFGVALFERLPRGMQATAAGEAVVTLTRRWRGDLDRIAAEIKQLQGVSRGLVRIAAMDSHANGLLPAVIDRLAAAHPAIALEIEIASTDRAATALVNGEVDLVAAFNLAPHREIRIVAMERLPLGCIVAPSHPLARRATVSLQEASAHPVALQSRALVIRRYLEARYGWLLHQRRSPVSTNSLQLVKQLARSGRYIAFTSELDAAPELLDGSLRFVPVRDRGAEPQSVSVAVGARRSPRIAELVATLAAEEVRALLARIRAAAPRRRRTSR